MLTIEKAVVEAMVAQAKREAPLEACGYLGERDGTIVEAYPMRNADASEEHFSFDPAEQFDVVRRIRACGHKPVAVYHSHPATPARPSEEDKRLAFDPTTSYVILSIAGGDPVVRSFRIRKGQVEEEEIHIADSRTAGGS
jgi:proteasome lid subunit RPN8/RPN11